MSRPAPRLGPRLRAIADQVLPGLVVGDLCCDHGRLAVALVLEGRVPRAIAVDINRPPLDKAAALVRAQGLANRVELREGDGALMLEPGEVGTVVLAGIGASLAERMISRAEQAGRWVGVTRLVVQVDHGFPRLGDLRATLGELGWAIVDELVAQDTARLYPIVVCERGPVGANDDDEADRDLGPVLRRRRDPLTRAWFERERERVERALVDMHAGVVDEPLRARYRRFLAALRSTG